MATEQQIRQLHALVADEPDWEVLERAGSTFASRVAPVTDEYVWWFQLEPLTPDDSEYPEDSHPRWRARCQKGEESDETTRSGPMRECTNWLEDREREWTRERQVAADLEAFAETRPRWAFYDQPLGRHYAGRRFEYSNGQRLLLSILPHEPSRRRGRLRAQINMAFAAGPEHVYMADTIDEAEEWVNQWDKLLAVPEKLASCDDRDEAEDQVARLSASEVASLGYLLEIPGSVQVTRAELVRKFAGVGR